jgi:hypothetical protein
MVTASVLHSHPSPPGARLSPGPTWHVPAAGIERLLELSEKIPLDGELTPVQAWSWIRGHPGFGGLEVGLKGVLGALVRCYG